MAERPNMDDVMRLWRRLSRMFPTWRLLVTGMFSRQAWVYFGNDLVSGLYRSKVGGQARALLAEASDADVRALAQLGGLNVQRGEYSFRFFVVAFVTGPIAAFLALRQLAPGLAERAAVHWGSTLLTVLVTYVLMFGYFFVGVWRMRQIAHVIAFEAIARGLHIAGEFSDMGQDGLGKSAP